MKRKFITTLLLSLMSAGAFAGTFSATSTGGTAYASSSGTGAALALSHQNALNVVVSTPFGSTSVTKANSTQLAKTSGDAQAGATGSAGAISGTTTITNPATAAQSTGTAATTSSGLGAALASASQRSSALSKSLAPGFSIVVTQASSNQLAGTIGNGTAVSSGGASAGAVSP
ncbi:MAG TPA: hypothetical protein VJ642_11920 [Chromobacteriaceae bacterium]|nr:hypothetical protein [Chromobacteriaceae bacterium]